MPSRSDRRNADRFGRWAETVALVWLMLHGYRVLRRRYRTHGGEIDLLMRRGRQLVAVEVKARREAAGLDLVSLHQQRRIVQAVRLFLAQHPKLAQYDVRFDVVCISPWRWPLHVPHAWIAEEP